MTTKDAEDPILHIGWPSLGGWLFVVRISDPQPAADGSRRRHIAGSNDEEQAQCMSVAEARALLPIVREQRPEARMVFSARKESVL